MKYNKGIISKLEKLRDDSRVPVSFFQNPGYFREVLDNLCARKIIKSIPTRKGQWEYRLKNSQALEKLIECFQKQSSSTENIDKVEATRITGDAHAANQSKYPSIPLRVTKKNTTIKHYHDIIDAYKICSKGMALYLPVNTDLGEWELNGSICLVENQRFFWEVEKIYKADYYIYLQGNFSNNIVKWLISSSMQKNPLIYFGDYDPTGIKLFLRIKKRIPHCEFFIPDNFEDLLKKYGNKLDLAKQHRDFNNLLDTDEPTLQRIRRNFEKTGKTLHQEALLI
jgi:Wadjet protein JetD, C-terminal